MASVLFDFLGVAFRPTGNQIAVGVGPGRGAFCTLRCQGCGCVSPNHKIPANLFHPLHFCVSRSNDKIMVLLP
jgi:hypothetical protein